jgi:RNA polymerase sigma-70 factor (ECF subfamily)
MQDDLVRRAQEGDHEAFCTLAQHVIGRLRGTARLILHDAARADDAVQECLVATWRSLPNLRDPARFDAWLHRLLVNACHRNMRRDRRRLVAEIPLPPDGDWPIIDATSSVAARDEMERAFRRLTDEQRTVLALVYFADLSHVEAASALGIPVGTAKSRVRRALDALRGALAADARLPVTAEKRTA